MEGREGDRDGGREGESLYKFHSLDLAVKLSRVLE